MKNFGKKKYFFLCQKHKQLHLGKKIYINGTLKLNSSNLNLKINIILLFEFNFNILLV